MKTADNITAGREKEVDIHYTHGEDKYRMTKDSSKIAQLSQSEPGTEPQMSESFLEPSSPGLLSS